MASFIRPHWAWLFPARRTIGKLLANVDLDGSDLRIGISALSIVTCSMFLPGASGGSNL
jgi:hypothetical protein